MGELSNIVSRLTSSGVLNLTFDQILPLCYSVVNRKAFDCIAGGLFILDNPHLKCYIPGKSLFSGLKLRYMEH
jgi:hypothetical protein